MSSAHDSGELKNIWKKFKIRTEFQYCDDKNSVRKTQRR